MPWDVKSAVPLMPHSQQIEREIDESAQTHTRRSLIATKTTRKQRNPLISNHKRAAVCG
jgi:hypothetical protein